jgi:ABC-type branched-subunit amino acid transport system substrate-binding protein
MQNTEGGTPAAADRFALPARFLRGACCIWAFASCFLLLASCTFPGTVRPTIKIGLVAPFEGQYRYVGYDVIYAVRLAVREVNKAGGVGGYSVELVAYDDAADPARAIEQARKLAVDPEVVAAIGHFRQAPTTAAADVYADAGIPLLSPGVSDAQAGAMAAEILAYLEEVDVDRTALVTQGGSLGAALRQEAGIEPIVRPDGAGWLAEVLPADAVVCDADPVTVGEVAKALDGSGWAGLFLGGPELAASDFGAVAGKAAEGALFVTPWPFPRDVPGSGQFVAAYQAMGPHVEPPGPLALPAYRAAWHLFAALEDDIAVNGAPTREGVTVALGLMQSGEAELYWYRVGGEGTFEQVR